jgi:hypothetical protein
VNDKIEQRLRHLVDPEMHNQDAFYAAQVACFRNFLLAAEMGMEDEGIDPRTIDRVLNRMVYATPDGASAYSRVAARDAELKAIMNGPPWNSKGRPW